MTQEELLARLLHRDGLMLVIDKPAGIPVHRGPRNLHDKTGDNLEAYFDALRFGLPKPPALAAYQQSPHISDQRASAHADPSGPGGLGGSESPSHVGRNG